MIGFVARRRHAPAIEIRNDDAKSLIRKPLRGFLDVIGEAPPLLEEHDSGGVAGLRRFGVKPGCSRAVRPDELDRALFGILPVEIGRLLRQQPRVRALDRRAGNAPGQPLRQRRVVGVRRERRVEVGRRNPPPLHHPLVHRTRIDVVVNRARGEGPPLVGHAQQPQRLAHRLAAAARIAAAIAKICRHTPV